MAIAFKYCLAAVFLCNLTHWIFQFWHPFCCLFVLGLMYNIHPKFTLLGAKPYRPMFGHVADQTKCTVLNLQVKPRRPTPQVSIAAE